MATSTIVSGNPWFQQASFNTSQSGALGSWTDGATVLPEAYFRTFADCFITDHKLFICGGHEDDFPDYTPLTSIITCNINTDGTLDTTSWDELTSAFDASFGHRLIVTGPRVYKIGGRVSANTTFHSVTRYAEIDSNGDIGSWSNGTTMPAGVCFGACCVTINRVFYIGGSHPSTDVTNKVYSAPIDSSGVIGTWSTETDFPLDTMTIGTGLSAFSTGTRLYVATQDYLYYAAIDQDDGTIGTWTDATPTSWERSRSQVICTAGKVYLLGTESGWNRAVHSAPIDEDGIVGSWSEELYELPREMQNSLVFATSSRLYLANSLYEERAFLYTSFSGGYNDYTGIGITTLSNDGAFGSLLPEVHGLTPFKAGHTETQLPVISGTGRSVEYHLHGNFQPRRPVVEASGYPSFFQGLYAPPLADFGGTASNSMIGWGNHVTRRPEYGGVAYFGQFTIAGQVVSVLPQVSAATVTFYIGQGSIVALRPVVSGSAVSTVSIFCDGDFRSRSPIYAGVGIAEVVGNGSFAPSVSAVSGRGNTDNYGSGQFEPRSPVINSAATVYSLSYGSFFPQICTVVGAGSSMIPVVGTGAVDSYQPVVDSEGYSVLIGRGVVRGIVPAVSGTGYHTNQGTGQFAPRRPAMVGVGFTVNYGVGAFNTYRPVVVGEGESTVPTIATGRVNSFLPVVDGATFMVPRGRGMAYSRLPVTVGTAIHLGVGAGNIRSIQPVIRGYVSAEQSLVLQFNRETIEDALLPAPSISETLSYTRVF